MTVTAATTSGRRSPRSNSDQVLRALAGRDTATIGELVEHTGLTARQVHNALTALRRCGQVGRVARGLYALTRAGAHASQRPASGRSPWGAVRTRFREAIAAQPERVWNAADLAEAIDINDAHAAVVLAEAARRGELVRVAPGRYQAASADTAQCVGVDRWRTVATLDGHLLLRRADGTLWAAAPATVSVA